MINNDLPENLIGDMKIEHLCVILQEEFNNLFKDNEIEFRYIGFSDFKLKEKFMESIQSLEKILKEKIGRNYEVINDIDINDL